MTVETKFAAVRSLLDEHNKIVGEGKPGFVDVELFFNQLKASGATTEDRLKGLSYEDIVECLPVFNGIKPKILAKDIAKIFRGRETEVESAPNYVSPKKAERMTRKELVDCFDPENLSSSVAKILATLAKNEPFIVFESGRTVDRASTLILLEEIVKNYKGRTNYSVGGEIKQVYRLGELPDNYADENPIYKGRPLRPDGTCDQTGRSWLGIPHVVQQLVQVIVEVVYKNNVTLDQAHALTDMAVGANASETLGNRYREAALEFSKRLRDGKLSLLKIALGAPEASRRPFDNGAKVNIQRPIDNSANLNYYANHGGKWIMNDQTPQVSMKKPGFWIRETPGKFN